MKNAFLTLCFWGIVLKIIAQGGGSPQLPIVGTWQITDAKTLANEAYSGTVQFSKRGQAFALQWGGAAGNAQGIGLQKNNKVFAGWSNEVPCGVVVYDIRGKTMDGQWALMSSDWGMGTEIVNNITDNLVGTFDISGTNPSIGQSPKKAADVPVQYKGKLTIEKNGETYICTWNTGNTSYSGVGMRDGNYFAVVWGLKEGAYGIICYTFNGNQANGNWFPAGARAFAYENLAKK
jgi:hypothetical protein